MSDSKIETENKKKKKFGLNPFEKIENEQQALSAAKAGAVVSVFLALSYILQLAFLHWSGKDTFGDVGSSVLISDVVALILALFLTWRILVRQPVWASIFVAVWFAIELVFKILAIANGQQTTNGGYIFMFFALAVAAIMTVRGSIKLRSFRKAQDSNSALAS